jgi:hypothetical protein
MPLQLVYTAYLDCHVLGKDSGQHRLMHLVQRRRLFLSSLDDRRGTDV